MIDNVERMEELIRIKPILEDFMNKYCCPHDMLVVQQRNIELFSGEICIPTKILD